jgi:uncharacterized membrane protein YhaH (DUF805 family)
MNVGLLSLLFGFRGRINRAKYWLALLIYVIAITITVLFAVRFGLGAPFFELFAILYLVILVSGIAIGIKRLHDRDRSGWWLVAFYVLPGVLSAIGKAIGVPVVFEVAGFVISIWALIELGFMPGAPGANQYGPDPLASSRQR